MKSFIIESKTHGIHRVIFDKPDYDLLIKMGGKIFFSGRHGHLYAQKCFGSPGDKHYKSIDIHRFLMNPKRGQYVDHINHNTLDNRRKNLRICSNADNLRNGRIRPNNTSGKTGVWFNKKAIKKKWMAEIKVNYKKICLGAYKTFNEAVKVRKEAEKKYFTT